jgi:hypothetical protein
MVGTQAVVNRPHLHAALQQSLHHCLVGRHAGDGLCRSGLLGRPSLKLLRRGRLVSAGQRLPVLAHSDTRQAKVARNRSIALASTAAFEHVSDLVHV